MRLQCTPTVFKCDSTEELRPKDGIIGQDRALSALKFGLNIAKAGFNIYVSGLAGTGSVNQKGEVQAIGGINEKIEGFFEVCRAKGLNGEQGALIPASNVRNLMLKEEVAAAVKGGRFHVYPVSTIDQGIEVLTGVKAGKRRKDGSFTPGSINDLVQKRLASLAEKLRDFTRGEEKEGKANGGGK